MGRDFLEVAVVVEMEYVLRTRHPEQRQYRRLMRVRLQPDISRWKLAYEGEAGEDPLDAVQLVLGLPARNQRGSKANGHCPSRKQKHTLLELISDSQVPRHAGSFHKSTPPGRHVPIGRSIRSSGIPVPVFFTSTSTISNPKRKKRKRYSPGLTSNRNLPRRSVVRTASGALPPIRKTLTCTRWSMSSVPSRTTTPAKTPTTSLGYSIV
jgi:hypothetical protein